ncbi:unnamed protein product [Echinostoma caproni]|uniref:PKD_channel domain-containing protein n=1 Tax=Echinostoma caproni TaxID=27848 RepID=A0A183ABY8_9TREM|nr:unnamed protein product [Echinostoma caproni]
MEAISTKLTQTVDFGTYVISSLEQSVELLTFSKSVFSYSLSLSFGRSRQTFFSAAVSFAIHTYEVLYDRHHLLINSLDASMAQYVELTWFAWVLVMWVVFTFAVTVYYLVRYCWAGARYLCEKAGLLQNSSNVEPIEAEHLD